jgi:hypothetical protein
LIYGGSDLEKTRRLKKFFNIAAIDMNALEKSMQEEKRTNNFNATSKV